MSRLFERVLTQLFLLKLERYHIYISPKTTLPQGLSEKNPLISWISVNAIFVESEHSASGGLLGGPEHKRGSQSQSLVSKIQLCNILLFPSFPHCPLCWLCCLRIYNKSQTAPRPKTLTKGALLFPYLPVCQFLFGGGHLGNIPKTSLNLLLFPMPCNTG